MLIGYLPIICGFLYEFFIVDLGESSDIIPVALPMVFGNNRNFQLFAAPRARAPPVFGCDKVCPHLSGAM